jgi:3-phenylpropionate/trans-cinnamate dioxygenase ferredoxin subunit
MLRHVVARRDEMPPGTHRIATVLGRTIDVFNLGGEYFVLRDRGPYEGGRLFRRLIGPPPTLSR